MSNYATNLGRVDEVAAVAAGYPQADTPRTETATAPTSTATDTGTGTRIVGPVKWTPRGVLGPLNCLDRLLKRRADRWRIPP